jgi:hypothetical protein
MAQKPEQIGRDRRLINADWRAIKRNTARWRRRQAKRLLDDAPTKRACYIGYVA